MALISEKKFAINSIGNGCNNKVNNQFNYYSQTSLLSTRVEFKSANEHSSDDSSEDEDIANQLKSKYHVLVPDSNHEKVKPCYGAPQASKLVKANIDFSQKLNNKDGNDLGQPKHTLYPREKIETMLDWKNASKIGSGLANLGNTCFMNSAIQCLTYCPPLVNYLNSVNVEHQDKCQQHFCMICLMIKHVSMALSRSAPVIKPLSICQRLKSIAKHFTFGRQEDAHEFLRYVVDHMWRSCLTIHENEMGIAGNASKFDHLTKSTTAINQIFGGYHRSQVQCLNCKEKSNTYDYFMDFMLDIQNVSSLQEALHKFTTPEVLSHDNAYKCSKCKKSVSARKQFTVYRAPNVATFQFKRFDCTRMFGKISKPISYPEKLNLQPYMSDKFKGSPQMYKLASVLVHLGASSNSGHYYCYVRNSNNSWYLMDDSHVSQVGLTEVLSQKAYILFYIRSTDGVQPQKNHIKAVPQMNLNVHQANAVNGKSESPQSTPQNQSKIFNSNFKFLGSQGSEKHNGFTNGNTVKATPLSATSLRLNFCNLKPSEQQVSFVSKKAALLVPYDKDSDDERDDDTSNDSEKFSPKGDPLKIQHLESHPSSSNSISQDTLLLNNRQSTNSATETSTQVKSSEPIKEPIPILKVKATTNSWQVVEATPSTKINDDKNLKAQSNWKISKSSDSGHQIEKKSTTTNGNILPSLSQGRVCVKVETTNHKEHSDLNNSDKVETEKKDKEKKKKRKKKDKDRQRKRECDVDVSWVERTKETVELERKLNPHANDPLEKRKFPLVDQESFAEETFNKRMKLSNGENSKKADIRDALLKNVPRGFGDNVKSWDGGESNLNRSITEDNQKSYIFDDNDEYNAEYDQGNLKKLRKEIGKLDVFQSKNLFQREHNKHANYLNATQESCFLRNSFNKSPKLNGGNNKREFKSNGTFVNGIAGGRYKDMHKERYSIGGKNCHNSPYNRCRSDSSSSNGHRMKNKFKQR